MEAEMEERPVNAEAGDYIEDDPEAWTAWLDAVRRYAPEFSSLAVHLDDADGAAEVIAGTMLSFLADTHDIYLRRERADHRDQLVREMGDELFRLRAAQADQAPVGEAYPRRGDWRHARWCEFERGSETECTCGLDALRAALAAPSRDADTAVGGLITELTLAAAGGMARVEVHPDLLRRAANTIAALAAPSRDAGLDVERLAQAFDLNGVNWPKRWGDNDFAWLARQVAAEYARLAADGAPFPAGVNRADSEGER